MSILADNRKWQKTVVNTDHVSYMFMDVWQVPRCVNMLASCGQTTCKEKKKKKSRMNSVPKKARPSAIEIRKKKKVLVGLIWPEQYKVCSPH